MRAGRVAAALVAVVALAGCSGDDRQTADNATGTTASTLSGPDAGRALQTVKAGTLTACSDVPHPPFEMEADGQYDGIDIELVRAVAGRLGLAPAFVDVEAGGLFGALDAGRCDLVASAVPVTDERRRTAELSAPYFEVGQSLLVRKGDEGAYGDLPALAGHRVGVQASSPGADYARANAGGATVEELGGADELFAALEARRVDAVVHDQPVNAYHARTTGRTVVAKTFAGGGRQYAFAMAKGNTALAEAVDGALAQVKADDTYPTILRRFLGDTTGRT